MEDSGVLSAFTESIEISGGCQWNFSILFSAPCSTKFERSVQNPAAQNSHWGHMGFWWAILPKRGITSRPAMDCSLWKEFPSLPVCLRDLLPGKFPARLFKQANFACLG
jgi:hypothetical protein